MTHRTWTYKWVVSIIGLVWVGACADDPSSSSTGGKSSTTDTSGGVTGSTSDSSSSGNNSTSTSGGKTSSTSSTSSSGSGGTDASGGSSGSGGSDATGGSGGSGGTGASGGSGGTGGGSGGTGGGSGGTGGGSGGTGGGSGGTGGGSGGTGGGSGGTGGGSGGTGGDAGGAGGMGEGGQGGAMPCEGNLFEGCGFESGTLEGWSARGGVTLTPTTADAYEGDYSVAVTGRTANWNGIAYNVLGLLETGVNYQATVYAKVISGGPTSVRLTRQLNCDDINGDQYVWVGNMDAVDVADGWVELSGSITLASDCPAITDLLYVEASEAAAEYYVDEPLLIEQ